MERSDRPPVGTFFSIGALVASGEISLGEGAAHHARVKRLEPGDPVRLTDGRGTTASGEIARMAKSDLIARCDAIFVSPPLRPVVLLAPVADRERMLWLAEKCAELSLTTWRPVVYERSRSVSPRGEGEAFRAKVRSRMIAALEQSGGAWLPEVEPEQSLEDALRRTGSGARFVFDAAGEGASGAGLGGADALALAVGPEGGFTPPERASFAASGWRALRLGATILRFETAAVVALGTSRALESPARVP